MHTENSLNILVLLSPEEKIQKLLLEPEKVDICYVYNQHPQNIISRCIKRVKLLMPFDSLAYSEEFLHKDLSKYDIIILDETIYPNRIIRNIRRRNKNCKLIYWMWNTVDYSNSKLRLYNRWKIWKELLTMRNYYNFTISSFDKGDCEKYNITYNNQVAPYFNDLTISNKLEKTIFFFGLDKGRLPYIKELYNEFTKYGYFCDFNVVPDARKKYNLSSFGAVTKQSFQPYKEIIKCEAPVKALLEILQNGQEGITWRALEALFYKKKLITNYKEIKQYDFYNPNNIFILGVDDIERFKVFMSTKFEDVPKEYVNKYTFRGWLSNMMKK